jgi:hypothetical protein
MKRKAKNQANIMTRKKHSKKIMIKKTKNHDMDFFLNGVVFVTSIIQG